jgi:hypothetical protein
MINKDTYTMKLWTLVLKTNNYYYWQHLEGYYNCTKDNNHPTTESGYYSLKALQEMKNDYSLSKEYKRLDK